MISFPRLECWNHMTNMATLVADADKKRDLLKVSLSTLREKNLILRKKMDQSSSNRKNSNLVT